MELEAEKYKLTEMGLIPRDWEVKTIGEISKLKNGYAFSSDFFSKVGPIVITPGNFKLEGGLKFNDRNTIRYSGFVTKEMQFNNGDLLIVMTDLTPDCNLLGKPGIVNSEEIILHNQRIGKITVTSSLVNQEYLYWFFVSDLFSKRMKETATGSTVRHTSVGSINNSLIALPTQAEQTAIATALSDTDALISSLEKLIAKKRNIKQGAMQKLLEPNPKASGGWEVRKLGEILEIDTDNLGADTNPEFIFNYIALEDVDAGFLRNITEMKFKNSPSRARRKIKKGDILMSTVRPNLKSHLLIKDEVSNWVCSTGFSVLRCDTRFVDFNFIFQHLFGTVINRQIESIITGSNYPSINGKEIRSLKISIPAIEEQTRISTILSDMDDEISALETKLEKYRKVKLGMMHNLLTGKIRLV